MNCFVASPGRLGNQLIMLYYIYGLYEGVDRIYAPHFSEYASYFNIEDRGILCDESFYLSNKGSFKEVYWENLNSQVPIIDFCGSRFSDLKLKGVFEKKVTDIMDTIGEGPLVSIHVRHGDYKWEFDGKCFFPLEYYIKAANQKVKDWGLLNYKLLFFSDSVQLQPIEGILVSKLTDGIAPIDLFLMSQCNYFIHTWSTFSLLAIELSKGSLKFKNNYIMDWGSN